MVVYKGTNMINLDLRTKTTAVYKPQYKRPCLIIVTFYLPVKEGELELNPLIVDPNVSICGYNLTSAWGYVQNGFQYRTLQVQGADWDEAEAEAEEAIQFAVDKLQEVFLKNTEITRKIPEPIERTYRLGAGWSVVS